MTYCHNNQPDCQGGNGDGGASSGGSRDGGGGSGTRAWMGRWLWLLWHNDATPIYSRSDNKGNLTMTTATPSPINSSHGGTTNAMVLAPPDPH